MAAQLTSLKKEMKSCKWQSLKILNTGDQGDTICWGAPEEVVLNPEMNKY